MKSSTVVVILVLQAVLVMGILAEVNAEGEGYFPKCCDNGRTFSGAMVCDDTATKCHPDCYTCVKVRELPVKMFRCADGRPNGDDGTPCPPPCKN